MSGSYHEHGHIKWADTLENAREALVKRWAQDCSEKPDTNRFVYASTNAEVNALNTALRQKRVDAGQIADGEFFETVRGTISVAIGDRVQFHGNDKRIGIYNGTLATVKEIEGHYVSVRFDDGRSATFNAKKFDKFGLGYAGTVYRGQGKTQTEVYALYDSAFAWNARTAYVGMTRHKAKVELFVPRELAQTGSELAARVRVDDDNMPASNYAVSPEHARKFRIDRVRNRLIRTMDRVRLEAAKAVPPEPRKGRKNHAS